MKLNIRWMVAALVIAALQLSACAGTPPASTKVSPAKVATIEGSNLKWVVLTDKAAERLDIQTTQVREDEVARTRTVGGEVVAAAEANAASSGGIWVRVHLNVSDLNQVDVSQPAFVRDLDDDEEDDEEGGLEAEADDPPDEVDDAEDNADGGGTLYFSVGDGGQTLVPGQRVWVRLSLVNGAGSRKIIPYAAVIYDVNGQTWVYTNPEPLTFVRQSVTIDYIEDDLAFLTEGPDTGTEVVVVGGAELYGTETGVSK
ncbi:MAG: hypothetical protein HYZ49_06790 [Chloroflexi bacterium]|nr:hypothetical protein [Chloroflexota bacterium]